MSILDKFLRCVYYTHMSHGAVRPQNILLDAVFWDYPRFRDEMFLRDFLERNRDNDGYRWVLARFLEHGRVVDTFRFFTAGEIAAGMDRIKISSYARKKWTRMLEVYG